MNFGYFTTFQALDKGLIERLGPTGFTVMTFSFSSNAVTLNSGILYHTALLFIGFATLFLAFFVLGMFGLLSSFSVPLLTLFTSYIIFLVADSFID
jgi:hypothetical protein